MTKAEQRKRNAAYHRRWRKKHPWRDRPGVKKRRELLDQLKSRPCADCKKKYPPYVIQFDHVRGRKLFNVGRTSGISTIRLLREVKKCDLVCANCHAERTWGNR